MRSKFILCSVIFAATVIPALAAEPPIDCNRLMAWMAGAASDSSLISMLQRHGSSIALGPASESELRTAGVSSEILTALHRLQLINGTHSPCSAALAKAAALVHHKQYEDADDIVSRLIADDPRNGSLHFALGYIKQQQGDWNSAFDEYTASKDADHESV